MNCIQMHIHCTIFLFIDKKHATTPFCEYMFVFNIAVALLCASYSHFYILCFTETLFKISKYQYTLVKRGVFKHDFELYFCYNCFAFYFILCDLSQRIRLYRCVYYVCYYIIQAAAGNDSLFYAPLRKYCFSLNKLNAEILRYFVFDFDIGDEQKCVCVPLCCKIQSTNITLFNWTFNNIISIIVGFRSKKYSNFFFFFRW